MKKNILKVYYGFVMFNNWFIASVPLLIWVLMFAIFGFSNDPFWEIILFSVLLFFFSIFFIIRALYMTQQAEISEEGIIIYSVIFSTIKVIKWNELIDVRTESLITFTSANGGYSSSKDWIVLYTDSSQQEKVHNGINNRKKNGPWYIACTKENLTVITEYIIKYAPHICDDPNVFF